MKVCFIGEPLARAGAGACTRGSVAIATIFPPTRTIVTLPGVHATQQLAYMEHLCQARAAQGLPPLSAAERERHWQSAVDLIVRGGEIQRDYRVRRRAFDTLFRHCKQDVGSFAYRWRHVLARLDATDPVALRRSLAASLDLANPPPLT